MIVPDPVLSFTHTKRVWYGRRAGGCAWVVYQAGRRGRRWAWACAEHVRCVRVCRGGVGELTLFLKTGRSHCLAICEAPARARVEGGKSLPRLSYIYIYFYSGHLNFVLFFYYSRLMDFLFRLFAICFAVCACRSQKRLTWPRSHNQFHNQRESARISRESAVNLGVHRP